MSGRRALAVAALGLASALCIAMVEVRIRRTGDPFYRFLVWNLFLAWVPLALALVAHARARGRRGLDLVGGALLVLWLLFFPNAPYLLTDFVHLDEDAVAPVWYDALMLSAFAWTALLVGFASLLLVQALVRRAAGAAAGWLCVVVALALASLGVYIGRFVRFNSWDALLHPRTVARVVHAQLQAESPKMAAALVALTGFLLVGYAVVYTFAGLRVGVEREESRAVPRR